MSAQEGDALGHQRSQSPPRMSFLDPAQGFQAAQNGQQDLFMGVLDNNASSNKDTSMQDTWNDLFLSAGQPEVQPQNAAATVNVPPVPPLPNTSDAADLQALYSQYFESIAQQQPHVGFETHVAPISNISTPHFTQSISAHALETSPVPATRDEDWRAAVESDRGSPTADNKRKAPRRQGVTCDQCRVKHLRCDLDVRRAASAIVSSKEITVTETKPSTGTAVHQIRCTRCEEKDFECTKTHAPPSRRYPRPSRTGKRIEQARLIHGISPTEIADAKLAAAARINASTILIRALTELRGAEVRITDRVMAGSLSLQLLNCFFATCHMQAPVVDFAHFSKTFNAANGDPRKMSIMSNGGSEEENLPSHIPHVEGLTSTVWPGTKVSKISSPGSTETLIAVLHAWAAHYTDAPIAFGSGYKQLENGDSRLQEVEDDGFAPELDAVGNEDRDASKGGQKRPKRKQGVACDTCRLRRVRCDVTERPDGVGCSRCEDKRIKCTDEYIQTKKAKLQAKNAKSGNTGNSSFEESLAANEGYTLSPDSSKLSPRTWISAKRDGIIRSYRPGDIEHNLRRGKARKAFCHALLNHALSLVHKYNLLEKPSLESIQVLSLLAPLLDGLDGTQAHIIADTAASHCGKLGMSIKLMVDETNRHDVENMLSTMQANRAYLTTWCRDAIVSGLNRRPPYFREDRAIEVLGKASFRKDAPVAATNTPSVRKGEVVLSGEMGLTFVIMTMVQIGALSRFVGNHIDNIEGRTTNPPTWERLNGAPMMTLAFSDRFSSRPTVAESKELERACAAVWNSLDSLMLFFDRCAAKAKSTMDSLQPFRPLGWIATTKICGSLLYLTIFRALGERYRANAAFLTSAEGSKVTEEDKMVGAALKNLFDKSMQRAISSSRKTARLIEVLLPLGILQTGGSIMKQIFPIAQFLAKIPSVADDSASSQRDNNRTLINHHNGSNATVSDFVNPQALHQQHGANPSSSIHPIITAETTPAKDQGNSIPFEEATSSAQIQILRELEDMHRLNLGPYTHSAKRREVDALIDGLSQLGYAWDTVEREINAIQAILKSVPFE